MKLAHALIGFATIAAAVPALAQMPPCDGQYATIRVSSVLPGKMPLFEQAVADQAAYYRSHGGGAAHLLRVLRYDPATHHSGYASDQAMTLTTHGDRGEPVKDAAWTKFVGEYKASSTIREEHRVCLPAM